MNAQWDLKEGGERNSRDLHLYKGREVKGTHKARFSKKVNVCVCCVCCVCAVCCVCVVCHVCMLAVCGVCVVCACCVVRVSPALSSSAVSQPTLRPWPLSVGCVPELAHIL